MPWYDNWGWASLTEIPGRYTDVPLPENIPEGYAANWTGRAWVVLPYLPPPTTSPRYRVTKLAFRNRFTAAEKAALELAAVHNSSLAVNHPSNLLAASLRANLADQRDATFIDLKRADTRAGVLALEQNGLLAPGRALQILDGPITEEERYVGEV